MNKIPWWRTSFGSDEVQKLAESVEAGHISQGPVTEEFEARIAEALDIPHAVAATNGSAVLLMSLLAMGVGRDDEVIMPDRSWVATAHAAQLIGAKVVLVDVLPDIPVMDVSQIRAKITPRTKSILPVHLNGRDSDMEEIQNIASEHGLSVIEDACQAMFSRNSTGFLGTQSDAGCFSLGMGKLVSTGQGGVVLTKSQETYETLKLVRNHGVIDNFTDTWNQLGFNFKFTDLLASFALVQLTRAQGRIAHLHKVYQIYENAISEFDLSFLKLIPVKTSSGELPLYVEIVCDEQRQLVEFLNSRGIQARPFPPSLHTSGYLGNPGEFPNSSAFHHQGVILPCGPERPLEEVEQVIEALRAFGASR